MKVKLNIQAIRTAERLMNKPFAQFDLSDEETLTLLLYGMVSENNDESFTVSTFKKMLESDKTAVEVMRKFRLEMEYVEQFKLPSDSKEDSEESDTEKPDIYMGELAAFMIVSGMDAEFVLYKMKLFEIPDYLKAIEHHAKDKMEGDRFWTYLSVLPHVDGKKLDSPEKLIVFPWEREELEIMKAAEAARGDKMFEKFINSKPIERNE